MQSDNEILKNIVAMAIEKALLKMGIPELEKIKNVLHTQYNIEFEDCLDNPEPLKKVLCDYFGYCYQDIFKSIEKSVDTITEEKRIIKFLVIMKG